MSRLGVCLLLLSGGLLVYDGYVYGERHGAVPPPDVTAIQTGMASWYGREQQGRLTADGETFDRHKFTAAHRHLPFNTMVRVTNRRNGRSVEVRVNDRGPYVRGRVLDLSEAAAKALDMKKEGVTPVKIEVLSTPGLPPPAPGSTLP